MGLGRHGAGTAELAGRPAVRLSARDDALSDGADTVLARVVVHAERAYAHAAQLGFDTVHLPLEQGANDVVAVSETFGGWGLQARSPSRRGCGSDTRRRARRCPRRRARSRRRDSRARGARTAPGTRGRIVLDARREQPLVELAVAHLRVVLGGEECRAEALRAVPCRPDQRHEPGRLRGLVEREVEVGVRTHRLADVARAAQLVEAVEMPRAAAASASVKRSAARRTASDSRASRTSNRSRSSSMSKSSTRAPWWGTCFARPSASSCRTASRIGEMLIPERPRQLVEPQRRAGGELSEDDRLAELLQGVLRHRAMTHPAFRNACHGATVPQPLIRCQTT